MDVIAMRKTSGEISGEITLNGHPQERTSFLRCSGYVEQFDIQQPELNVRETVEFCARLRLDGRDPAVGGLEGKLKYVDHVLETMELTNIQNLQVGSYEEGGLTFEQRKRLAIACELAGSPSVLFLGKCKGSIFLFTDCFDPDRLHDTELYQRPNPFFHCTLQILQMSRPQDWILVVLSL